LKNSKVQVTWNFSWTEKLPTEEFILLLICSSSTRRDDLLLDEVTSENVDLRKYLSEMNPVEAMEFVDKNIKGTLNNEEFLMSMNK
jgi:transcription termination factor Rho